MTNRSAAELDGMATDIVAELERAQGRIRELEKRLLVVERTLGDVALDAADLIEKHQDKTHAWPQRVRSIRDRARAALKGDGDV